MCADGTGDREMDLFCKHEIAVCLFLSFHIEIQQCGYRRLVGTVTSGDYFEGKEFSLVFFQTSPLTETNSKPVKKKKKPQNNSWTN